MSMDESAVPDAAARIHCERHGDMQEAFVCEHLLEGSKLGFFTGSTDTTNPRPDAWCSSCERIRSEHGGWNPESEALITVKLVCGGCYDEIRARNILSRHDGTVQ